MEFSDSGVVVFVGVVNVVVVVAFTFVEYAVTSASCTHIVNSFGRH